MHNLLNTLSKPIPFIDDPKLKFKIVIFITLFPSLFIIVFNPFSIISDGQGIIIYLAVLGFGFVSGSVTYLFIISIPKLFKKLFNPFTIRNAIIYYTLFLVIIAIGNFIYKNAIGNFDSFHIQEFIKILTRTVVIAFIPITLIVFWVYNFSLKKNLIIAKELNNKINDKSMKDSLLIYSQNKKELLNIRYNDLLFIENADNYVIVHFIENQKTIKKIIRTTLKNIEKKVTLPTTTRCHRSFIVNLKKAQIVKGNSRGLFIKLLNTEKEIPVSRRYVKLISELLLFR